MAQPRPRGLLAPCQGHPKRRASSVFACLTAPPPASHYAAHAADPPRSHPRPAASAPLAPAGAAAQRSPSSLHPRFFLAPTSLHPCFILPAPSHPSSPPPHAPTSSPTPLNSLACNMSHIACVHSFLDLSDMHMPERAVHPSPPPSATDPCPLCGQPLTCNC
ncbi:MAG: hypothetical protein J3K34DRAFT_437697 [Monoraphidium minutum]|nr:MAG: hypothetical protein J3K34DRAFT_437697 [Monoraphidium minutum]